MFQGSDYDYETARHRVGGWAGGGRGPSPLRSVALSCPHGRGLSPNPCLTVKENEHFYLCEQGEKTRCINIIVLQYYNDVHPDEERNVIDINTP